MRKYLVSYVLFFSIISSGFSQNKPLLDIFEDNFRKATLEIKLEVIKDASLIEGMERLFSTALRWCIDNFKESAKNATFKELMQISVNEVKKRSYEPASRELLDLFQLELDTFLRVSILDALTVIAPSDPQVVKTFNRFLSLGNESYRNAKVYDKEVISACITDLGKIGDPSSFSPILVALILRYSDDVSRIADEALSGLTGERKAMYLDFILEERFPDKVSGLKRAIVDGKLSIEDKNMIAEFALNVSIHTAAITPEHKQSAAELRDASLAFLAENHWSHASDILIENFNLTVADYDSNKSGKSLVLRAIDALGNMRSHAAAKRLVLYLDFVNSFTERGKKYDEEIVLHVIAALKNLGDSVARDSLLYTRYLDYSENVKKSAYDAFQRLQ